MAKMNLLPWREEKRKQQAKVFGFQFGAGIALTGVLCLAANTAITSKMDFHQQRNNYLKTEIRALESELSEIAELETTKNKLLARMEIIQQLQTQRPKVVHLFHEISAAMPSGVQLSGLSQNGNQLTLRGHTQSNSRVSEFMRQLDASPWMSSPRVLNITADPDDNSSTFELVLSHTTPNKKQGEIAKGQENG